MSTETLALAVVVVLALAAQSVRVLVKLPKSERLGRLLVLAVAGGLGALLLSELVSWDYWAFGLALGLGVVELAPIVTGVAKKLIRRKGGDKTDQC
jgi:hypothetical protein